MNRFLGLIIFLSVVLFSCGGSSTEDQLLGSWYFSFENPNALDGQVTQVETFYNFNSDGTVLSASAIFSEEMKSDTRVEGVIVTGKWSLSDDDKKIIVTMDKNSAYKPEAEETSIESISSSELCLGVIENASNVPYDKLCASKISDEEFYNLTADFISIEDWFSILEKRAYVTEAELLLKEVAGASEMYEAMHGGQQTTLDELESRAYIAISDGLKREWKVEISGDIFIATSSDEMDGGAGKELRYNRATGEFSGYGHE